LSSAEAASRFPAVFGLLKISFKQRVKKQYWLSSGLALELELELELALELILIRLKAED
jgi:hypothetical protein